jgi:hypothetical protein
MKAGGAAATADSERKIATVMAALAGVGNVQIEYRWNSGEPNQGAQMEPRFPNLMTVDVKRWSVGEFATKSKGIGGSSAVVCGRPLRSARGHTI